LKFQNKGNYAAVIITDEWLNDDLMQLITAENNLSETVGNLKVRQVEGGYIEMTFPNRRPKPVSKFPIELSKGLSIKPKEVLLSQQASEREGILKCRLEDNYVKVSGKAVQYLEGFIDI